MATGSMAGAALQLVCIALGAAVYLPFLRRYEQVADERECDEYRSLLAAFLDAERSGRSVELAAMPGTIGAMAASLAEDVRAAVRARAFALHYQPQFDTAGRAVGAEALLRFEHPIYGMVYPPLVIQLAQELEFLDDLERAVFERAFDDAARVEALAHDGILHPSFSVSVNATARLLQSGEGVQFVIDGVHKRGLDAGRVIVEATEREALRWDDGASALLARLTDAGVPLSIDDFSMGRTSFQYLETSVFTEVKLDGTIAKGVLENERYADIVSSITRLSSQLGFTVLAPSTWKPPNSATCWSAWDVRASKATCTHPHCRSTRWSSV